MEAAEGANPVADLARARWTEPSALPGSPLGHGRITLLRRRPHDGVRRVGEGRGGLSFCAAKRPAALDEIATMLLRASRIDGVTGAVIIGAHRQTKQDETKMKVSPLLRLPSIFACYAKARMRMR